jgi:GAF domain-containing protein
MRTRLAWTFAGIALVLVILDVVVTAQYRPLLSEAAVALHGFPFVDGAVVGCAVMGALVLSRDDRHVVGWLLNVVGATSAVSLLAESYALWVSDDGPGSRAMGGISGWVASVFGGQLAIAGIALMFLLAPDGRLLSRRWRYAALVAVAGALLCFGVLVSENPTTYDIRAPDNSVGPVRGLLLSLGFLLISAALLASLVSMLVRLGRSRGEQRQQLRLIALSAGLLSGGLVSLLVVQIANGGRQTWASSLPLFISYLLLPVLFAVAVLRYRLYDVEVILNRTLVLAAGTAFAAIGYTTLVVSVGKLVGHRTGGFWLSLLATTLVAVAFQPLRRRVVRLANRLAFGSRAQPYEELADFSRRLVETPSVDTLLPAVAAAAGEALSARGAAATLSMPGGRTLSGDWGRASLAGTAVHGATVRSGDVVLGSIEVALPLGRALRPSDERLLQALADQAAVAFRNSALEAQLAGHVADLARTTHELAESRARIIEADDEVRRTLEEAISREVLPHLVAVHDELARARTGASTTGTDELVADVNSALEALRELTRGVFPTQLARAGLEPALRSYLARSGLPTTLLVEPALTTTRFPPRVEAAVYFCATAAAGGVPAPTSIELGVEDSTLGLAINGFTSAGLDLQRIVDRVDAVGGSLVEDDHALTLRIPVASDRESADLVAGGGPRL